MVIIHNIFTLIFNDYYFQVRKSLEALSVLLDQESFPNFVQSNHDFDSASPLVKNIQS